MLEDEIIQSSPIEKPKNPLESFMPLWLIENKLKKKQRRRIAEYVQDFNTQLQDIPLITDEEKELITEDDHLAILKATVLKAHARERRQKNTQLFRKSAVQLHGSITTALSQVLTDTPSNLNIFIMNAVPFKKLHNDIHDDELSATVDAILQLRALRKEAKKFKKDPQKVSTYVQAYDTLYTRLMKLFLSDDPGSFSYPLTKDHLGKIPRRQFLKMAGSAAVIASGGTILAEVAKLEELLSSNTFAQRSHTLMKEIDQDPENTQLQNAFATLLFSQIAILGGSIRNPFAAENLSHYLYGNGTTLDITDSYLKAIEETGLSPHEFIQKALSFAVNVQPLIIQGDEYEKVILEKAQEDLPQAKDFSCVVQSVGTQSQGYAMGRHTLRADWKISAIEEISPELVQYVSSYTDTLRDVEVLFSVQKVTLTTPFVEVYDRYYFNPDSDEAFGKGMQVRSPEIQVFLNHFHSLLGIDNLQPYMGQHNYQQFMKGWIAFDSKSFDYLKSRGFAHDFDMIGKIEMTQPIQVEVITKPQS